MTSKAATVDEYLAELPEDRRQAISAVRQVILDNLPQGYEEQMQYGMIGYVVPKSIYPKGYHCNPKEPMPYAGLGSQKQHMSLYVCSIYGHPDVDAWFRSAYAASGKKMDMGKGCVRFKKLDDLPLDVVGQLIARVSVEECIARYEEVVAQSKASRKK
jgi:uncharacterized protein YdhG (YjbR/CyaY superfamily)